MKGSDKAVVFGIVMAIILAAFYVKVVSPKREKASTLGKDITSLQSQVDEQENNAQLGEAARQQFPAYYGRLVLLGKAVPAQADTPSLLVQLNTLADRTNVTFQGLLLSAGSGGSTTPTPTPSPSPPSSSPSGSTTTSTTPSPSGAPSSSSSTPASSTTPASPTEASTANLPLGAAVGSAGLATMPYELNFVGSYFDVADFLKGVDDLVHLQQSGQVSADGRLLTIDGFSLKPATDMKPGDPNPTLTVSLGVTSYVTPATEGLTAGASPSGPAPSVTAPQTQPASQPVSP